MSRASYLLAPGGVLALAVAVAAAPAVKPRTAPDPLLGRWAATAMHISGVPNDQWQGLEYEFTEAGGWVIYRDRRELPGPRSFTTDRKAKVPTIDLSENGQTYLGVYQVSPDGQTLTVSFSTASKDGRPAGVEPGADRTIAFKRVRPTD
jgi:uncharacterized protein (TIGR03067 family)